MYYAELTMSEQKGQQTEEIGRFFYKKSIFFYDSEKRGKIQEKERELNKMIQGNFSFRNGHV